MLGSFWRWGVGGAHWALTFLLTCSRRTSWLPFPTSPGRSLNLGLVPHSSVIGSPLPTPRAPHLHQPPPQQPHLWTKRKEVPGSAPGSGAPDFPAGSTPSEPPRPLWAGLLGSYEAATSPITRFPPPTQWVTKWVGGFESLTPSGCGLE